MNHDIRAFVGFIWKSNRALILFGMAFIASVQLLLIYLNSTLDIAPVLEVLMTQLPPQMKELITEEVMSQLSPQGAIAFGMEHPLVITLFTFISISMISKNIGSGSGNQIMEILLAHPFKRKVMLNSLYLYNLLIIVILVISMSVGAILAMVFFLEKDGTILIKMIQANLNAFMLHAFIMSYTMFFSVFLKDITSAVRYSALITLVFYFLDILSDLWDVLSFTRYFNFFSYFDPSSIMNGNAHFISDFILLFLGSLIFYLVSRRIFLRKDIL